MYMSSSINKMRIHPASSGIHIAVSAFHIDYTNPTTELDEKPSELHTSDMTDSLEALVLRMNHMVERAWPHLKRMMQRASSH